MSGTYDVRIWVLREHKGRDRKTGKARSSCRVRWEVDGREFGQSFKTKALAESFRSQLVVAQREGVAFDKATGLPAPMARELNTKTWYEHAVAFVDMKWPRAAGKHRRSIAEALATVTPALRSTDRGVPADDEIRRALYSWAFNKARRDAGRPPDDLAPTITWLAANTVKLTGLTDAALVRKALDLIALRIDGKPAAATTIARKRAVFYGALRYAVELRLLDSHPMDHVQWTAPKSDDEIDRRVVVNPQQARQLLDAVGEREPRLVAFFGCMYFAALRPAEALHLRIDECELPELGWGWLRLTGSTQHVGQDWGDSGEARDVPRRLSWSACYGVTSTSSAPTPTAGCSWRAATPAGRSRSAPIPASGGRHARRHSRQLSKDHRWQRCPTTYVTRGLAVA